MRHFRSRSLAFPSATLATVARAEASIETGNFSAWTVTPAVTGPEFADSREGVAAGHAQVLVQIAVHDRAGPAVAGGAALKVPRPGTDVATAD